ncbi:putative baseplate assembly protein [Arthrobacter dokdonensis]|uniref:putative baseplate assembly protein n=1 Tax=Arthrobacter dokdonellae TaxID=2211210 RepID=UPI001013CC21|nr:putative baseplate assembly protein [Arthrobacter dokdonellae]
MTARLSSGAHTPLAALRTRDPGDASMAMLDAWATAGDVLTFYQERLCNEGYLRSATEQRSVRELAALVGWRPRPGVAATAYLAYTVDPHTSEVLIPAGSRANSIPGPDETMQAFESSDDLPARASWNELRPRMARAQTAASVIADGLYLAGTATKLAPNDPLVLDLGTGTVQAVRVRTVTEDPVAQLTRVELADWQGGSFGASAQRQALAASRAAMDAAAGTATAQRVSLVLDRLERLVGTVPASELARQAGANAMPALGRELAAARDRGYARLIPALEAAHAILASIAAPGPEPAGAPAGRTPARPADRAGGREENPVDILVDGLLRPASVPPANAQKLERSYSATFAGAGEVYPQLLAGLYANLGPTLFPALAAERISSSTTLSVSALRQRCPLFGHNAPVPGSFKGGVYVPPTSDWALAPDEHANVAYLDGARELLQAGQYVVMQHGADTDPGDFTAELTVIKTVRTGSRLAYGLAAPATTMVLSDAWWKPRGRDFPDGPDTMGTLRASTAYAGQEALELAREPITEDVGGRELELDGLYDGLTAGRWVIVTGVRTDVAAAGVQGAELLMLAAVVHTGQRGDGGILAGEERHTFLTFARPLAYTYQRDTVSVFGNVAHATHGETRQEVLGAGNAALALQQFTLKQSPLTYLAAPTPAGVASTLVVRVNGVQWPEAPSLGYLSGSRRGFFTTAAPTGSTTITFGNPPHGQRLPTGTDNVRAGYRSGIGAPGNVRPGQISQLATRPLGVMAVTNPLRTSGGADAEPSELTRSNAPRSVTALDRLVSVGDYADFAATFAGIGKASSALLYAGGSALLQVTIAGLGDVPIDAGSDLFRNLRSALILYGDPQLRVRLVAREALALVLSANVKVAADYDWTLVEPAVRAALLRTYGFDAMALGRDVPTSAVTAAMAAVPGVDYVDVDVFRTLRAAELTAGVADLTGGPTPNSPLQAGDDPGTQPPRRIRVAPDRVESGAALPAQLAWFQAAVPDSLILNEVRP